MKVSIIMCTYNVEAFIDRAITSILNQTYTDWELIISDDASKDKTPELVKKYLADPRIKYYRHEENMGYVKNKNWAFRQAAGELLTQLDSDDTCPATRLAQQVEAFIINPEIKMCGTNYQVINEYDRVQIAAKQYKNDLLISHIKRDYPFWFPVLMFRKEIIEEFGLFSEYFNGIYGDDYYWTIRVNKKYPVYFIKDCLYNYRISSNSLTNSFTNLRKLIAEDIITELYRQQMDTGTDWLETGEVDKANAYEKQLLDDKTLMSEKYRVWAAKAIDMKKWGEAKNLLNLSFSLKKTNPVYYRTLVYYWKQKMLSKTQKA